MKAIDMLIACAQQRQPVVGGEVWLVGAGPGDAELLTIKALRAISQAEVLVFDRLVSPAVMALVPKQALRIDVGKSPRCHTLSQPEINQLLVELAQAGNRVVRLKGGDPFIFGRGGEEMVALQRHGIPCHIVPGITAASGCAAATGIPLTHRDHAQSVRFVTGHCRDGGLKLDWRALVSDGQTLVFYMGLALGASIAEQLMRHGMSAETPLAIIERGTQPQQRVLTATLVELPALLTRERPQSPGLLVIGSVVGLYRAGHWQAQQVTPAVAV
ncbi:uroporphyrinogen-III C-methyltransferase [Serratia odorifera]|uniref:uroporphyrinogen-III C-methyltransferase n=1 Tax=Serratia odorifera DSM 4582 TaxID=667129 RepID=D4E503_SEROD|nr:uroporphyrinogen-III C-methyltransferase [Serratia odorifera]EFE95199.1 uroporphyrinogen-III C-methyltransferase [Serratia odorifera DSM 4582]MBJ2064449.1 uroporphyrinogen-III C-methyltransferase [Serratia odorifera]PNK89857.1 uroporphyrinogen-III C-methyltransferase [Serratia odorifera]RII70559.1 uroporphyrinogen-III C-methyltransferase [Serratia odorifera]HEJ9094112.1 uroporphyrinogen-III C-methyltransferase [Serratia odorifera]